MTAARRGVTIFGGMAGVSRCLSLTSTYDPEHGYYVTQDFAAYP